MFEIADLMTPEPLKVARHETAVRCRQMMKTAGTRHLIVVDEDEKHPVALVTDYALALALDHDEVWRSGVPVPTFTAGQRVDQALQTLLHSTQDAIVVVDDDSRPIGIFTEHDVVRIAPSLLTGVMLAVRRPSRPVFSMDPQDTWDTALDTMTTQGIRHLPIVSENGVVVGVVSFRDLMAAGATRGLNGTVDTLWKGETVHVAIEGCPLDRVAAKMAEHHVGCLPLLDFAHRLVGIITRTDLTELCLASLRGRHSLSRVWENGVEPTEETWLKPNDGGGAK